MQFLRIPAVFKKLLGNADNKERLSELIEKESMDRKQRHGIGVAVQKSSAMV